MANSTEDNKTYMSVVFGNDEFDKEKVERALDRAWAVRDFEIGLYWQRALYFWGFITISFAGYFVTLEQDDLGDEYSMLAICIGFFFSVAWLLVNKASKFWQENWECHIDLLEDQVEGRLYKTILMNKTSQINPISGYHYSVSKINQYMSVVVIIIWIFLGFLQIFYSELDGGSQLVTCLSPVVFMYLLPSAFIVAVILMCLLCKTSFVEKKSDEFRPLQTSKYKYFDRKIGL